MRKTMGKGCSLQGGAVGVAPVVDVEVGVDRVLHLGAHRVAGWAHRGAGRAHRVAGCVHRVAGPAHRVAGWVNRVAGPVRRVAG